MKQSVFTNRVMSNCEDQSLSVYLPKIYDLGREYCTPQFLGLDSGKRSHRIADQLIRGVPYTSDRHPWPRGDEGLPLQPLVQLDLQNVSALLNENLGDGTLQVWVSIKAEDNILRVIPRPDIAEPLTEPDQWVESAPWNDEDSADCIFGYALAPNPRVEWEAKGPMFPTPHRVLNTWEGGLRIVAESLEHALEAGKIRSSAKLVGNFHLGGWPWTVGNEGDVVDYSADGAKLLICVRDGQGMFTAQVIYTKISGTPEFKLVLKYM